MWYRASIAEMPLCGGGGYRTSTSHALQGGNAQERGRGYRTQLAMLRHQKPHVFPENFLFKPPGHLNHAMQ